MLQIQDFKYSQGWLDKFKKRHCIEKKVLHGESGSLDIVEVESHRTVLKELLKTYAPNDIYNADELALFYKLLPNRSLADANADEHGLKNNKERITCMVCCNSTGTDKIRLLVINKSKKPHCFGRFNPDSIVSYYHNSKVSSIVII